MDTPATNWDDVKIKKDRERREVYIVLWKGKTWVEGRGNVQPVILVVREWKEES